MGKVEFDQVITLLPLLTTKERNSIGRLLNQNTPICRKDFSPNEMGFHQAFRRTLFNNHLRRSPSVDMLQSPRYDQWKQFCGTSAEFVRNLNPKATITQIDLMCTWLCTHALESMKTRNIPLTLTSFMQAYSRDVTGDAEWSSILTNWFPGYDHNMVARCIIGGSYRESL